jgi:hypothetical protein
MRLRALTAPLCNLFWRLSFREHRDQDTVLNTLSQAVQEGSS